MWNKAFCMKQWRHKQHTKPEKVTKLQRCDNDKNERNQTQYLILEIKKGINNKRFFEMITEA